MTAMKKCLMIAVATAVLLTGCTWKPLPGDSSQLAIRRISDGYEFVLEPCAGDKLFKLDISELDKPQDSWDIEAPVSFSGDIRNVRFFQAPVGWTMKGSLSVIRPGVRYHSYALSGRAGAIAAIPEFTLEQISVLRDGEVLGRVSSVESEPMSYGEFQEHAAATC